MRIVFTRDQVIARCDELEELIGKLRDADKELRARSYDPGRGWPNSSGPGGGSGAGPTILVDDEDGNPERIRVTSVELAALSPDPMNDAKQLLWWKLHSALASLTDAWNRYERATRHLRAQPPPTPTDPDQIWCTSCARAGVNEPRGNPKKVGKDSTLCGFCNDYARAHNGTLPPTRLCELRSEGVRLTEPIVTSVELAEQREQRERASSKRRKKRARR